MDIKERLLSIGLSDEQSQKVIDEIIDKEYVSKADYDAVSEENKTLKGTVADRDKQLEKLKTSAGDNENLKKQIEDLQKLNADQKKAYEAEMAGLRLDNAVDRALAAAGARNNKAVKGLIDMSKVKLGEDGSLVGFDEQLSEVKKSDGYLFMEKQQTKQTFKGFQPGASGDIKPGANVDTSKMSYDELCAYLEQNPNTKL